MASSSLPPIVQRIVVENPTAIPQAMQAAAVSINGATSAATANAQAMQTMAAATNQVTQASNVAAPAIDKVTYSTTEARVAAMGLGQEFGVRMPRALTRFLSQSETIGPILAKAFSVVAIIAVVEILARLPALIKEGTDALMGFDETAKKAYEDTVAGSRAAEDSQRKLNKELREAALIGTTGPVKAQAELKDAIADHQALADKLAVEKTRVRELNEELRKVKTGPGPLDTAMSAAVGTILGGNLKDLKSIGRTADEIKKDIAEAEKEAAKTSIDLAESAPAAIRAAKELQVAENEAATQSAASWRHLAEAKISGEEQSNLAIRALGLKTQDEEINMAQQLVDKKLAADVKYLREKARLSPLGSPERITAKDDSGKEDLLSVITATQEAQNKKDAIANKGLEDQRRIDEENAKAQIESTQKTAEAQYQIEEQSARQRAELGLSTAEQERSSLLAALDKETEAERKTLTDKLALEKQYHAQDLAAQTTIEGQITALTLKATAERAKINADVNRKIAEDAKRIAEETARKQEEINNEQLRIDEETATNKLRLNEITLSQWQQQETAALQKWLAAQLAVAKQAEAALAAAGQKESAEYKKYVDQETLVKQQAAQKQMQIDQQVAAHWHQLQSQILNDFNRTLIAIQSGEVKWGQGFAKLFTSLTQQAELFFLKWAEQAALSWLKQEIQDVTGWGVKAATAATGAAAVAAATKAAAEGQVAVDAGLAFAGTMAYYSMIDPPIAPAMASAAYAITLIGGQFEKGGVVPRDMVAQVHEGEGVFSRPVMESLQRGGGGATGDTYYNNTVNYHNHGQSAALTPDQVLNHAMKAARRRNM